MNTAQKLAAAFRRHRDLGHTIVGVVVALFALLLAVAAGVVVYLLTGDGGPPK